MKTLSLFLLCAPLFAGGVPIKDKHLSGDVTVSGSTPASVFHINGVRDFEFNAMPKIEYAAPITGGTGTSSAPASLAQQRHSSRFKPKQKHK